MFGRGKKRDYEQPTSPDEIRKEIEAGFPIEPNHQQPFSIETGAIASLIMDTDREAFARTADFGTRFNMKLKWGGFRIEELPHSELRLLHQDSPAYGRNFSVYFNRVKLGKLALEAMANSSVQAHLDGLYFWLDLNYPTMLEYGDIRSFLLDIAHAASDGNDMKDRATEVDRSLTMCLWNQIRARNELAVMTFAQNGAAMWAIPRNH
ncbi:hypothetical protein X760_31685 [Mesorhizobium sp. LSHC422A00]|uniref:hypothetical protein n=1 Tax=Mesorhizobium sp. LSHC422A00 TaxID=1287294 RepID=UPI0003CF6792|nr:hypothetical protein [Mesorhizobium sp. LSHC422A00]ESX50804.1 hypothetical protein X760_31685 [Mesorhizobium sp. LSHC422A00]